MSMPEKLENVQSVLSSVKVELRVLFDVVTINLHCASNYEAQVLFEDILDRVKDGQPLIIAPHKKK